MAIERKVDMSNNNSQDPRQISPDTAAKESAEIPDEQLKDVSGAGYATGGASVSKDADVKVKVRRDGYGLGG